MEERTRGPRVLKGQPVPEASAEQSAGPMRSNRGSMLTGKTAVVTGSARGIGWAIAVECAAHGCNVVWRKKLPLANTWPNDFAEGFGPRTCAVARRGRGICRSVY